MLFKFTQLTRNSSSWALSWVDIDDTSCLFNIDIAYISEWSESWLSDEPWSISNLDRVKTF